MQWIHTYLNYEHVYIKFVYISIRWLHNIIIECDYEDNEFL